MSTTPAPTDTRQRLIAATVELFRRQGYNGTSLKQIVAAADTTTGSLYHFFPGGKDELTAEVLRTSGQAYGELITLIMTEAVDAATAMTDAFNGAASVLTETDFIDPCPIGTIAREVASTNDALRQVADEVVTGWVDTISAIFLEAGIDQARARPLAQLAVASIEGGFMMARAGRGVDAFIEIGQLVGESVAAELNR